MRCTGAQGSSEGLGCEGVFVRGFVRIGFWGCERGAGGFSTCLAGEVCFSPCLGLTCMRDHYAEMLALDGASGCGISIRPKPGVPVRGADAPRCGAQVFKGIWGLGSEEEDYVLLTRWKP